MTAVPRPRQESQDPLDRDLVLEDLHRFAMGLSSRDLQPQEGRTADALDEPAGQDPVSLRERRSPRISRSWNLTDELPQLRTRTFTPLS